MTRQDCGVCDDGSGSMDSCMEIATHTCAEAFHEGSLAECEAICAATGTECEDAFPELTTEEPTTEEPTTEDGIEETTDAVATTGDGNCPEEKKGIETCIRCRVYIDQRS
eukprot:GHVO01033295.1.p1 GENE.GHVO01033295.1~~GHVO01033295.1.p1  ORF type:complete len:110 (-),score=16.35 GHVO01033295.1:93-422(-)